MTWNELIDRLNSIPEADREQTAVFYSELEGVNHVIDEMEMVDMGESGPWDCNVGNDEMTITWALIP